EAHGFAQTGGVTGAVKAYLAQANLNATLVANLDKKNIGLLRLYAKTGKAPSPFIEVMACESGCVTGPCIYNDKVNSVKQMNTELQKMK
ncbi:MAG: hydrogenase, partial [Bacteroidales bacterium]|nr:hydrogenase [Bacteroidales bacterium]